MDNPIGISIVAELFSLFDARDLRGLVTAAATALGGWLAPLRVEIARCEADDSGVVGAAVEPNAGVIDTHRLISQSLLSVMHKPEVVPLSGPSDLGGYGEVVRANAAGGRWLLFLPAERRGRCIGYAAIALRDLPSAPSLRPDMMAAMARLFSAALAEIELVRRLATLSQRAHRENLHLRRDRERDTARERLVGSSVAMTDALAAAEAVATHRTPVLLRGESGTGKELFALYVHERSNRSHRPFLKVNCGAVPEGLVESELFGHERGAFTGAHRRHAGVFERAAGGTVLLDEVAELPLVAQVKLLRVVQEGHYQRVGGEEQLSADVRIVAATHRDLETMIASRQFRADLYYRLNVFPIVLPPLRERVQDIPALVAILLARTAFRLGRAEVPRIDADGLAQLEAYRWPGNIRELENVLERATILSPGPTLKLPILPSSSLPAATSSARLVSVVREHIEATVRACNGQIYGRDGAAARLGLPPSTLQSK